MQINNITCSLAQKIRIYSHSYVLQILIILSFYPVVLNTELNMIFFTYEAIVLFLHLNILYIYQSLFPIISSPGEFILQCSTLIQKRQSGECFFVCLICFLFCLVGYQCKVLWLLRKFIHEIHHHFNINSGHFRVQVVPW